MLMKTIAVICNNKSEWQLFHDTLTFSLTKQNKPYKSMCADRFKPSVICSIKDNTSYIHLPCNAYMVKEIMQIFKLEIDSVVWMCNIDESVLGVLFREGDLWLNLN